MNYPNSDKALQVAEATEVLRKAISDLHAGQDDPLFDASALEQECTRIAQDTADITGMPLDYALTRIANAVGTVHDKMRRNQ